MDTQQIGRNAEISEKSKPDQVASMVDSLYKTLERAENLIADMKGDSIEVKQPSGSIKTEKRSFEFVWEGLPGSLAEINGRLNDLLQRIRILTLGL